MYWFAVLFGNSKFEIKWYTSTFRIGNVFERFDDVDVNLKEYKAECSLNGRTIKAARVHYLKSELGYYEVKLCCVHDCQSTSQKSKKLFVKSLLEPALNIALDWACMTNLQKISRKR